MISLLQGVVYGFAQHTYLCQVLLLLLGGRLHSLKCSFTLKSFNIQVNNFCHLFIISSFFFHYLTIYENMQKVAKQLEQTFCELLHMDSNPTIVSHTCMHTPSLKTIFTFLNQSIYICFIKRTTISWIVLTYQTLNLTL